MFSSCTSISKGEVFMKNFATSKVIGEKIIQFRSHDGCINTLQGIRHIPESRYNLIFLGALYREGSNINTEGDLMKVFKDAHVKFQAERGIAVILSFKIRGCKAIGDYDGFELG